MADGAGRFDGEGGESRELNLVDQAAMRTRDVIIIREVVIPPCCAGRVRTSDAGGCILQLLVLGLLVFTCVGLFVLLVAGLAVLIAWLVRKPPFGPAVEDYRAARQYASRPSWGGPGDGK
jgi:hypothetical protein